MASPRAYEPAPEKASAAIARTVLLRHIKVRGEANPYDPIYAEHFEKRRCFVWRTLPRESTGQMVFAGL